MPRRTPTELVAEEAATSSPVRRSSRVAARRSSTEAAQTTAKSTRTRRASQEDSLDDYVEYKPATRTRRANSLLDEEKDDGKKQSGRQPAKKDPPATRRRNSMSSEPEEAKPATRRRKSSADSVEEEPTRRVTRGRRPSVDKDDEEAKKTPAKTRRRLSVTDNVSKMEAIEEQTKEESPKPNVDLKLSVLREEEDEPPKKSPKLDRTELNNISAGSDGSFRFNLNMSVPSEELNESKISSNNSDKENSPVKQQQNEIVDVFKPKMKDISFVEPMEVDVTINQTKLIDLNSPNRSRLSLRKSLDKNCAEMDDLSLRIDDDDDEEPIKVTNILTVEEKVSAGGENKGTKVLQVELVDVVFEDDEKTGSESDENRTGATRRLQVDLVDEVFHEKSTLKTLETSSGLISSDDEEEAKKNGISTAEKAAEEKINDEKRLSAKQKSSASPKNEIEKETNEKRSPSKENQVLVQDDVNKSNKMASTPDKVDEKTEQRSKNDSYSQSPKDGSRSEGEKSPVSKKKLSTDVTVEEVAESTITTRSSLKKRLSGSPISKMGDLNGISENESTSQKRLSDEEGNASIDKSPTKRKTVSGGVDGEEKKIVTRSASKQRYSDQSFSKSGDESFDDEEKSVDKITKTSSCSPDEGKTVNTHSLSSKSDSFSKNEDFEERTNEEDNNSEENSASSGVKLVKTRSSLKNRWSSSPNIESVKPTKRISNNSLSGSSFEEKTEDSNEESEDGESENVTKRFSGGSEIIKTRSSLKKTSPNVSNVVKLRSSLDKNLSRNENIEISSDEDKSFETKKKNMSGSSFEEKTEDSNEESEDAESENVTKRFSGGSEIIKTRSSLKKASPNVSTAVKTRSSLDKNHSRNENIEISSDEDKSFETKKKNIAGSSSEEEIEESKNEEDKNVSRTSTSSESVQTRSSLKKRLSESPKVAKTRSSLSSDSFSKNEDINICSSDEEDKEINSSSSSNRKTVQDTTTKTENSVSVSKSEDQKFVTDKRNSSTPNKKLIEEKPMKKTRLVNIDPEASAKLDRLLEQILSSDDEEQTEEEETNSLFDDMAEEGEEDTPSEDSNAIIDEGESIHSTDTEERQHDDEDYEKDSFICDDEIEELLSGEEYDLSSEKNDDLQPNDGKSGRIAQRPVDEMDEQEDVIIVNEEKKENKIKILENITLNPPNNEIQDASLMKRRSNHKRTSSISILENLKVEDLKETDIGERISDIVESFCNNKSKGEISMNLSLEYAENSSSSEDNDSMRISRKRKSDESEDYSKKLESPPSKKSRKSIQQDKNRRHSVSFDETVNENKIDSTKKRLSKSAEKLPVVKKLKSKKDKKQMNDLKQQTFNIFDQLINEEKKNRPVRKIFPSRQLEQTNNTWRVEKVVVKPSTTSITKEERAVFNKMERKIHPKDFKNQMLYNKNRVARVDTKKLLDKKRAF